MLGAACVYVSRVLNVVAGLVPGAHKYDQLLCICCVVLAVGFAACVLGALINRRVEP